MSKNRTIKQQIESGFSSGFGWLLGCAWFGLVIGGILNAFGTEAYFAEGHHPSRLLGWLMLAAAAVIFIITANRWKRVFPGIMVAATLGSILELERGHAVNLPSVLIPRWIAAVQLVAIASVAVLSFTFKNRPLNALDRSALLMFAASIYPGGLEVTNRKAPVTLIGGALCIFVAWAFDRFKTAHKPLPTPQS